MANTKSKKTAKKSTSKAKAVATKSEKTVQAKTAAVTSASAIASKGNPFKGFFKKKYDDNENILTIFKSPKIWGAIAGEVIGTMLLTLLMITLGVYQPLYIMIGMIGITMAVYALSGANLNPAITVGMMASRRISAIRGVLYIVAQVVGAWLGLIIMSGFRGLGGETAAELPVVTALEDKTLWSCIFIELMGAIVFGFFFCRAQSYKTAKGAFTYAALIAGGLTLAILFSVVVSSNYLGLQNNFVLNPAVAIMEQIFPAVSDNFGELMGAVAQAALTYIIVPMVGAVIGFYAADASKRLAGEE